MHSSPARKTLGSYLACTAASALASCLPPGMRRSPGICLRSGGTEPRPLVKRCPRSDAMSPDVLLLTSASLGFMVLAAGAYALLYAAARLRNSRTLLILAGLAYAAL